MNLGELSMFGVEGTEVTPGLANFIRDTGVGGVILFARNIIDPEQVRRLIGDMRDAAGKPLIVAVDQEGGRVARLKKPFTELPAMAALGKIKDGEEKAGKVGWLLGMELAACGFNTDFAPVLDVVIAEKDSAIGDRAFSGDPQVVAKLGVSFIRGIQSAGVAACGKHFPGHGDTRTDSHIALPVMDQTPEMLKMREFVPFRVAIAAGVAAIMTAHLKVNSLDSEVPATISDRIIGGLLRAEMGFDGVVFTDDLTMKGIAGLYPPSESAWRAVKAGCDVAMVCHGKSDMLAALDGIRTAVKDGRLSEKTVEKTLTRIEIFKKKFCMVENPPPMDVIGCSEHLKVVEGIVK